MDNNAKIAKGIRAIAHQNTNIFSYGKMVVCEVTAITGLTCTVLYDKTKYPTSPHKTYFEDVRLGVIAIGDKVSLITPKIGTKVFVRSIDGTLENLTIDRCQEAEKMEVFTGDLSFLFSKDGLKVTKNGVTKSSLLVDAEGFKISQETMVYDVSKDGLSFEQGTDNKHKFLLDEKGFHDTIDKTQIEMTKDGFLIKKDDETLQKLLLDIIKMIQGLVLASPSGVSTGLVSPTPQELVEFNDRIKKLLV